MKSNVVTYVTSFAVGAAAGTAIALLNAPQSGQKTRAKLRKRVAEARSQTQKTITKVQVRTMDKIDGFQNFVNDLSDEVIHLIERFKKAIRRIAEKPKTVLARAK